LVELTGLTQRQVGYALAGLRDAGLVATDGGRGIKDTRYRLAASST
jgi:DNA-binding transcriptional ArsR family regulator